MMKNHVDQDREKIGLDRILFFSDAIIAIAMTLMALEIQLPESVAVEHLRQALTETLPTLQNYMLSFLVVAIYWVEHHRMFKYITGYDGRLVWLNLLFLAMIVLVPAATDLVDRFGDQDPLAVVIYAACLAATGFAVALIWWYATRRHRLVDADLDPSLIRLVTWSRLMAPIVFLLSIPIAFLDPDAAMYTWITIFPLSFVPNLLYRHEGVDAGEP
jgi:uncharacterized membrane protein